VLRHDPFEAQAAGVLKDERPLGLQVLIELHAVPCAAVAGCASTVNEAG
jgi:hypothetical protein